MTVVRFDRAFKVARLVWLWVIVCLEYGPAEFVVPGGELRLLKKDRAAGV